MTDEELLKHLPPTGPNATFDPERFSRTFRPQGKGAADARPGVCDGQRTGWQCRHYWAASFKDEIRNQGDLHEGKRQRLCLMTDHEPDDLGDNGAEMATYCSRYEPSLVRFDPVFDSHAAHPTPLPPGHWHPPVANLFEYLRLLARNARALLQRGQRP